MSVLTEAASPATSERDVKLDALRERLNGAVAALVTGEDWKRAIEFAARFRSRSLRNAWLIWAQHAAAYEAGETDAPTPTYVAGFKQWKALGRSVMKGKRGYQIFAPHTALFASATPSDPLVAPAAQGRTTGPRGAGALPDGRISCGLRLGHLGHAR